MELRSVRYFVAVAEQLHFGRAAERMNVVQSAISQQIKRLEEELGTQLFLRTGSEVRLSEAGRQMLPECRRLLAQADEAIRIARQAGAGLRGKINFGFIDNSISSLIRPLVGEFRRHRRDIELGLQSLNRVEQTKALEDRLLDIGLMPTPVPSDEFDREIFVSAPLVAALPHDHPLVENSFIALGELQQEPFILLPVAMRSRLLEIVLTACAAASFTPRIVQEAPQMHTILALVGAGLGVTLVPRWVATEVVRDVVFRPLKPESTNYELELIFVWRRDNLNPALAGFRDIARMVAKRPEFNTGVLSE